MTRVTAAARLHFGLLSVPAPGSPGRHFGGVGLMVAAPGLAVRVERADAWPTPPDALPARAQAFAERVVAALEPELRSPLTVTVEACPPEHAGLGVGTQLGLSVARAALWELAGRELPATELARLAGRGERSAVGVHGFDRGGLLVEGGRRTRGEISPLVARRDFPDWPVVLARADAPAWHGVAERAAFARPRPDSSHADRLCRLVLTELLPSLAEHDYDGFAAALTAYNRLAGEPFAADQGGAYATAAIQAFVTLAGELGAPAAGQSSWGPTAFAVCPDSACAERLAEAARGAGAAAVVTRGANGGSVRPA